MALLLKIVIGCLIAIAIVAIGCVVAFILFIKHLSKSCKNNNLDTPFAVHLHEDLAADWVDNKKTKPFIDEFLKLGFTSGKAYTIEEMEQVKCFSFHNEKFVAVLYQIEKYGLFFDIVHRRSESEALTVSTMPHAGDFQSPPGQEKIPMPGVGISEAYALISEKSKGLPTLTIEPENFRDFFEACYKEEQAYRNRNGGVTFDEFKTIADKEPKKYTDSQVRKAYIDHKKSELDNWNYTGLTEYFEKNDGSDTDQDLDGYCFIVPNKTDAEAFIKYLNDHDMVLDEHAERLEKAFATAVLGRSLL